MAVSFLNYIILWCARAGLDPNDIPYVNICTLSQAKL